ncbi:MAG: tRNA (adenosine(37)-N6)-threonylcarbamoyltransferase complex dimerization subunit type 1 TsaB [Caulobacteraceae bacterium]
MVLALDTAQNACSVAVLDGDRVLASLTEPMQRGHQERLAPMAEQVMAQAGVGFDQLDRIGVTVGPGSFTGLRVGLAFAKSMSLALDIPCSGVGTLEALAAGESGFVVSAIDAKRDQIYLQIFQDGVSLMAPDGLDLGTAAARLTELWSGGAAKIVGTGAPLLDGVLTDARIDARDFPDIIALARLIQRKPALTARPQPLYLRAPDAKTIAERAQAKADAQA